MSHAWAPAASYCGAMNSAASQSRSARCDGHSPCEPRSASVFDSPVPKNCRQLRLTNARAVSGFCVDTSQFARSRRVARRPPVFERRP